MLFPCRILYKTKEKYALRHNAQRHLEQPPVKSKAAAAAAAMPKQPLRAMHYKVDETPRSPNKAHTSQLPIPSNIEARPP